MTWEEWKSSREAKREVLRKYGVDAPSRKRVSYNWSERHMRKAFNGSRIPEFAVQKEAGK